MKQLLENADDTPRPHWLKHVADNYSTAHTTTTED
jgi:hypothetical protein